MFYEKVASYCEKNGLSISAFEEKCGIGNGTIGRWRLSNSKPSLQTLEKIQKATGISIEEWISNGKAAESEVG